MTNDTQGPEVVAYGAIADYGNYEVSRNPICLGNDKLITLQSHQEAVAKKDAALLACVEAMKAYRGLIEYHYPNGYDRYSDAITQAKEVLK